MECRVIRTGDPPTDLYHHGTKGMKWGNRLYQNKDGSLTPLGRLRYGSGSSGSGGKSSTKKVSRKVRKQREAALEKARQVKAEKQAKEKSDAETRERLLKSTDAKEIYENRHLLTDAELNARVNRIDLENRLSSKIVKDDTKTGMDYVNDKMRKTKDTLDNATSLYRSVDNAYSTVANSSIGKVLAKKLGLEPPKKKIDLDDFWENRHTKTSQEMMDMNKWLTAEESIEKKRDAKKKAEKESKEKADKETKESDKQTEQKVENTPKKKEDKKNDSQQEKNSYNDQISKNVSEITKSTKRISDGVEIVDDGRTYAEDLLRRLEKEMSRGGK